jgi:hypothetical protein
MVELQCNQFYGNNVLEEWRSVAPAVEAHRRLHAARFVRPVSQQS